LKICYLANAGSIHTQRWARHFSKTGHRVTVVSFDQNGIEGVDVVALPRSVPGRRWNILWNTVRVRHLVGDLCPDILHAHYVTSYGLAGALSGWHPYVATAWGTDVLVEPERSRIYRRMVRFSLHRADLVTSMAPHMTEHLVKKGYAPADRVITLPFGVDTAEFHPGRRMRRHGEAAPLVVSTRRPDHGMDVDTFVRAIPAVLDSMRTPRFVVAGDGPLRREMERLAGEIGVADRVEFRGEISHREMCDLLGTADVFVSTSPSDGNNISLNEAMACGAFPVATDIPANRAWIESGDNGLLYPCRDAGRLAGAVLEALRKPEWRRSVMEKNWEIVRTRASWSRSMEEITSHYRRLIEESRQGGKGRGHEKKEG